MELNLATEKKHEQMKLKGILGTLVLILSIGSGLFAQDSTSTDDCAKFRSLYYQYLKQKMYTDAADFWEKAVASCGEAGLDGKFYTNGRYIYSKLAKEEGITDERKAEINQKIYDIYEAGMAVNGGDPVWVADYASKLVTDKSKDYAKMDSLFGATIHVLKDEAKSTHIKQYFKHLIINKFNTAPAEEKEAARSVVIDEYIVLSEYVDAALKRAKAEDKEKEIKRQESAQKFLDKYFLKIAKDCDVIAPVLDEKFDKIPEGEEGLAWTLTTYPLTYKRLSMCKV